MKNIIDAYISAEDEIRYEYKAIYRQLTNRNLVGASGKQIQDFIPKEDLDYCGNSGKNFARLMAFREYVVLEQLAVNELVSLKILLTFSRRIQDLAKFAKSGQVHF